MTDEKWQETIGQIKDSFKVVEDVTEPLADGPGEVEWIIFEGPLGRMKLERISKPVVTDEKALGSKRIGSDKTIIRHYSETERVYTLKAYRLDPDTDEWVEIEPGQTFNQE